MLTLADMDFPKKKLIKLCQEVVNMSDMEVIDKKINEVATKELDALEETLKHMDLDSIRSEVNKMLDDCSLNELQKVARILVTMARKSFQDEQLNNLYLPQVKVSPVYV